MNTSTVTITRTADADKKTLTYSITITKADGETLTGNRPSYELAMEYIALQLREEGWS